MPWCAPRPGACCAPGPTEHTPCLPVHRQVAGARLRRTVLAQCTRPTRAGSGGGEEGSDWLALLDSAALEMPLPAVCPAAEPGGPAAGGKQPAAHCSAVFVPGRLCRAQLWVPTAALAAGAPGERPAGGAAERLPGICSGLAHAAAAALQAARLAHEHALCARVYYTPACVPRAPLESALSEAWRCALGCGPGAVPPAAYVPVLAVGCTPAADAALLVEIVALA